MPIKRKKTHPKNAPTVTTPEEPEYDEDGIPTNRAALKEFMMRMFSHWQVAEFLRQHGFRDVEIAMEELNTYCLKMRTEDAGLTKATVKQQVAQSVDQLESYGGFKWRLGLIVVVITGGQNVEASFNVEETQIAVAL